MNTMRNADSLAGKEERPHPDIIKKAVGDNVLMIRTIDLLRYINAIQNGRATADEFRRIILSESGWLEVSASAEATGFHKAE